MRYGVPAELNDREVNIIVLQQGDELKVLGALPAGSEGSLTPKQMIQIKEGDKIALLFHADLFVDVDEDFPDDYDGSFWLVDEAFTVGSDGLSVEEWWALEGDFLYGFTIFDLQSEEYYTDFIPYDPESDA